MKAITLQRHGQMQDEHRATGPEECNCFGDSGLHASTHVPIGSDKEHCDLCGLPIQSESTDVLSAVNQSS